MPEDEERVDELLLVLRAQSGDRQALDRLFASLQDRLYRYIAGVVSDPSLAEDVLQEVFLRIYRKLRWLRDPDLLRPWAYRIATHEAFRRLRRERAWKEQVRDDELLERFPAGATEPSSPDVMRELLPDSLDCLSPASRAVITLYYLHELSFGETAAALGIPVGTVKSRLAYGLETLRKRVKR